MITALLGALAVAFVAGATSLRSDAGPTDRDPRIARVIAWLAGSYIVLGELARAQLGAASLGTARSAAGLMLVVGLLAWAVATRHVAVRTRMRLVLVGCAAIVLAHELPWPWPAEARAQIEQARPWSFAIASTLGAAVIGGAVARRWMLDERAFGRGIATWLLGWAAAAAVLSIAEVPAAPTVAAAVVVALGGAIVGVHALPVTSRMPPAVRETLPAVAQLTDPEAIRRRMAEGLRSLFPGSAIEVFRLRGAPQSVLPHSREISRSLSDAIAARGVVLVDEAAVLPAALAHELAAFGRGVVIPIGFESLSFGVLHIDHARPTTEMIVVARRFADLLGHRIETQRLGHELDAQRRIAALGAVAAAVVHDLRSPLSSVRLNLQMATMSDARLARDPTITLAHAELGRLESMLGGLLDLGRPRGAGQDRIDVREAAAKAVERSKARAGVLGVRLELDPASGTGRVRGDQERLVRALGNLIDNALDASADDDVVRVTTRFAVDTAHIEIVDRGHGDAATLRDRSAYSFASEKPTGCGLGLVIVRDTAEAYGGRLDFVKVEPRGVMARISLPAQEVGTS